MSYGHFTIELVMARFRNEVILLEHIHIWDLEGKTEDYFHFVQRLNNHVLCAPAPACCALSQTRDVFLRPEHEDRWAGPQ